MSRQIKSMSLHFPPHSQRRLGGQVRRDRRLPEGGGRRNHDKAEVGLRDLVRSLLPEADARLQREEPLVPRILAASLPVQTEGTPAGEQRLQPHLHLLVLLPSHRLRWDATNKQVHFLHRERVSAPSVRTGHQDGLRHQCHLLHGLWSACHAGGSLSRIQGITLACVCAETLQVCKTLFCVDGRVCVRQCVPSTDANCWSSS